MSYHGLQSFAKALVDPSDRVCVSSDFSSIRFAMKAIQVQVSRDLFGITSLENLANPKGILLTECSTQTASYIAFGHSRRLIYFQIFW
jgi:hypothetical protein